MIDDAKEDEDDTDLAVDNELIFTFPVLWLTVVSPNFEAELTGEWIDGQDYTIEWRSTHPEIIAIFVEWLCGRRLLHPDGISYVEKIGQHLNDSTDYARTLEALKTAYYQLLQLYSLAVGYNAPMLRQDALGTLMEIINISKIPPLPDMVHWSYSQFGTTIMPLHKAMVYSYSRLGAFGASLKACAGRNIPEEFFLGVAIEMQRSPGGQYSYNPCDYHEYDGDVVEALMKTKGEAELVL